MSIVISETSPRALLDTAMELSYNLNLMDEVATQDGRPGLPTPRGPGFVLKEVESVLTQIRTDLDVSYEAPDLVPPLMMRLRLHIDSISSVLTGNNVAFAEQNTTTLYELIESLSLLNRSVCTTERRNGMSTCTIS